MTRRSTLQSLFDWANPRRLAASFFCLCTSHKSAEAQVPTHLLHNVAIRAQDEQDKSSNELEDGMRGVNGGVMCCTTLTSNRLWATSKEGISAPSSCTQSRHVHLSEVTEYDQMCGQLEVQALTKESRDAHGTHKVCTQAPRSLAGAWAIPTQQGGKA